MFLSEVVHLQREKIGAIRLNLRRVLEKAKKKRPWLKRTKKENDHGACPLKNWNPSGK